MPGPVSDSYDPEFGTSANAEEVADAIKAVRDRISEAIGTEELKYILDVVRGKNGKDKTLVIRNERELRILRFALNRALESI
ncbi:hypothetical protein Rctr197k_233 [Virus Rctr197k]|nr:hypothetical protein Rctr197k_233 [Virus Rctr197k]